MIKIKFVEQSLRFKKKKKTKSLLHLFSKRCRKFLGPIPLPTPQKIDFLGRDGAMNFSTLARNKHQSRKPKKVNAVFKSRDQNANCRFGHKFGLFTNVNNFKFLSVYLSCFLYFIYSLTYFEFYHCQKLNKKCISFIIQYEINLLVRAFSNKQLPILRATTG